MEPFFDFGLFELAAVLGLLRLVKSAKARIGGWRKTARLKAGTTGITPAAPARITTAAQARLTTAAQARGSTRSR